MKKLQKSNRRVLCGVCGGVAEFFNIDPTIVRLITVAVVVFGFGTGVILYIAGALLMPDANFYFDEDENLESANESEYSKSNSTQKNKKSKIKNSTKTHSNEDFDEFFK